MKNIKRLGLTFIMLLTTSSFVLAQESEIVMTKEELKSFLEKVADSRKDQLRLVRAAKLNKAVLKDNGKSYEQKKHNNSNNESSYDLRHELERVNDRIDNLYMLNAGIIRANGSTSTILVPAQSATAPVTPTNDALALQKLQNELDNLKSQLQSENVENAEGASTVEDRIADAQTTEERRDALKDLLKKFENYKKQVFFANDSDVLTAADYAYIKDVTEVLKKYPELSVVLEGWASPKGNANYNKQLSMRRSESVERALLDNGIAPNRVVSSFKGEDHSTTEAMARRVDMSVILK